MKPLFNLQKIEETRIFNQKVVEAHYEYFDYWLKITFLHWDFWLSVFFSIVPWILWLKLRKKESSSRLLYAGFFVIIVSVWMDFLGTCFGFWRYTGKVIPTMPSYIPWDYCLIPVIVMLIIQYKPHVSPIWKSLIFAGIGTFIGEPLFFLLGFYVIEKWNMLYSFPIYAVIYLISHRISRAKNFKELE